MNSDQFDFSTQPYRGTRDFFPKDTRKLNYIFSTWRRVVSSFGYLEYLAPLLERWKIYAAKTGEEIVNKQLYWFKDQAGRKLAIRPEMTPSVSRMVAAKARQLPKPIRWFSIANFMRYEKPQRGRAREFWQLNVDIFGEESVAADAEIIEIAVALMKAFNASSEMFSIRVNNRKWIDYWMVEVLGVKKNLKRLRRIIDQMPRRSAEETAQQLEDLGLSANQTDKVLAISDQKVEDLEEHQDKNEGAEELMGLFKNLSERGLLNYVEYDASIVRGLDYYTGMVFEQIDLNPQNNRSMFGGGRYDGLTDIFGVEKLAATGFAPGELPMQIFLDSWDLWPDFKDPVQVLVTVFNSSLQVESWKLANRLRESGISTELYLTAEDSLSAQINYADRKNIPYVCIIGPDEVVEKQVRIKRLIDGKQTTLARDKVAGWFK